MGALDVQTAKIKRSQGELRLKHQAGTRSVKSWCVTLRSLDFIPQPGSREMFKGFELVSHSCPVYNQFIDIESKGCTGKRRKRK